VNTTGEAVPWRRLRLTWLLIGALALIAYGCASSGWNDDDVSDDDDSAADDDDAGDDDAGDDDAGDDDAGDDDAGDDDASLVDLDAATVPEFPDCTGNQVRFVLGDGTEIGPVDGLDSSSFANHTQQFKIQLGSSSLWTAITGHVEGMNTGVPIAFQSPAQSPGNAVLQSFVGASDIGGSDPALAVAYGMQASGLDKRVGGSVVFDSLPEAGQVTSGTFSGIVQWFIGPLTPRVVLLGVAGCFSGTLEATDGGGGDAP